MKKIFLLLSASLLSVCSWAQSSVICDVNNDGDVSVTDVFVLVDLLLSGGDDSTCDLDGDGEVSLSDIFVVVDYIFKSSEKLCPDDHHPHMIDLGLPSGTKWACCNVADDPSEQYPTSYGTYYAWGETSGKSIYNDVTYLYATGVDKDGNGWYDDYHEDTHLFGIWQYLGSDIAGTQYDVAHVRWGGLWVMPSSVQQQELIDNCTSEWTTVNGVNGQIFKGNNGGSIFLPAAGYLSNDVLCNAGSRGYCWSSTQNPSDSYDAYYAYSLYFSSGFVVRYGNNRDCGRSVRPVSR